MLAACNIGAKVCFYNGRGVDLFLVGEYVFVVVVGDYENLIELKVYLFREVMLMLMNKFDNQKLKRLNFKGLN